MLTRASQGYTYSVFNLVYETNVASCRIWDALGFKRIGRVKACGNLRSHPDDLVDAIIYGRDLGPEGEDFVSEERFDKIRYYLKHGTYPSGADRAEKSRLRSAATHYKLLPDEDGQGERLMLKDKEVVSDPQRQYEIARNVHAQQHGGINKTTATIAEKFHWVRIKETVSLVIKNCPDCKESATKAPTVRPIGENNNNNGAAVNQFRKAAGGNGGHNLDPNSMIERLVNFDQTEPQPQTNDRNISLSQSSSEGMQTPTVPVANMHALQHYNDIPLDPQIMASQPPSTHHNYAPHPNTYASGNAQYIDLSDMSNPHSQLKSEHHHPMDDTRMATERHVREGDEPMAYQDGEGMVHGARGGDVEMSVGEEERGGDGDIDLEELLRRG